MRIFDEGEGGGLCIPQEPTPNTKCLNDMPCKCLRHKDVQGVRGHAPPENF